MSKINPTSKGKTEGRLAGGFGNAAASQSNLALLRRAVLANLLWEDIAYQDGKVVSAEIDRLIPLCAPQEVFDLAIEARENRSCVILRYIWPHKCAVANRTESLWGSFFRALLPERTCFLTFSPFTGKTEDALCATRPKSVWEKRSITLTNISLLNMTGIRRSSYAM